MTKIYVKLYDDFGITGSDFVQTHSTELRRIVFSPDGVHCVSVVSFKDGTLLFTNEAAVEFNFSISRNRRILAVVLYRRNATSLAINNNWLLMDEGVRNWTINTNPNLILSENLNIEFSGSKLARIDFKINESPVAGAFFTERDLVFVRTNGNHVFPRLSDHIQREADSLPLTEEKVASFLHQHPDFAAQLPVTVAQVSEFLVNNPDFSANLPVNENQVLAFLDEHDEFTKNVGKAFFQSLMNATQWFSN